MGGIEVQGLDKLLQDLDAMSPDLNSARRAAIKSSTKKADELIKKRIAKREQISSKAVNQYRVKTKTYSYMGTIWVGHEPIKVRYVGKYAVIKGVGVKVGRRTIKSAFVAKSKTGHQGVFQRTGKGTGWTAGRSRKSSPNLPIKESRIPFEHAESEIKRISKEVEISFERTLEFELKKRIES